MSTSGCRGRSPSRDDHATRLGSPSRLALLPCGGSAHDSGLPVTTVEVPYSVAAALPSLSVFDITNEVSRELSRSSVRDGIAYICATEPLSLIRVNERESGFFCDLEDMLARIVPFEASERERLMLMLL